MRLEMAEKVMGILELLQRPKGLKREPISIKNLLVHEHMVPAERPVLTLADGSMGIMWELIPFSHEMMPLKAMSDLCENLGRIVGALKRPGVFLQVIFESEPSSEIKVPPYFLEPKTSAQKILVHRLHEIKDLAKNPRENITLLRRRVFLTLRLERLEAVSKVVSFGPERVGERFKAQVKDIVSCAKDLEYGLESAGVSFRVLEGSDILGVLQGVFHDQKTRSFKSFAEGATYRSLKESLLHDFVRMKPTGVSVGEDTWEAASWADQPPVVYPGMMAQLLELEGPVRVVLCLRSLPEQSDLERKSFFLRRAEDPVGELQRDDIRETLDRMARGEGLYGVSLHLMVRHVKRSLEELEDGRGTLEVLSKIRTLTRIPWIRERYGAPAVFFASLPFGFGEKEARFLGREKRVLSGSLGCYLPVYGSFQGTQKLLQPMLSRGGELAWLSPFASETSPHMAILASSGGGKSFFAQNLMMSFFADTKDPLVFIIDKKTSYEIFARVVGEDHGFQVLKPPRDYPNIFRGRLDPLRLPVMVGLIKSALSLVSNNMVLGASEEMLLSESIRLTFEQNELDARTTYRDLSLQEKNVSQLKIPRLSDVRDNLFIVAASSGVSRTVAETLAEAMAPFTGLGPYARLFDREEYDSLDPEAPGVSLYDIDGVASHPVLSTLTTQMILSEILRQICRPENKGRPGMLVIEEAGVLAGSSPEIVSFIQDAWKTFRKLGIACIGLTNEVDDYRLKPGPREIWNVSPNKVILKMLAKDLDKAFSPDVQGRSLLQDEHLSRVAQSLTKKDGVYSQGLFISDEVRGSFVYMPTGFDYWCAASKPLEAETVHHVAGCFKGCEKTYFEAVSWLAQHFPHGLRDSAGEVRGLTPLELSQIKDGL